MDSGDLLKQIFDRYLEVHKGEPKVTAFKQFIDVIIKAEIKPLCKSQGKFAGDDTDWRRAQKANFAGRGAKWVKIKTEDIMPSIERFEGEGIDCSDYRAWITQAGYAWIRYAGPRIQNGVGQASFEVRTEGSKIDHPKQLHYMYDNNLMAHIELLGNTPHTLSLEVINAVEADDANRSDDEDPVSDVSDASEEAVEAVEAVEEEASTPIPDSADPEAWEAYLAAEGMAADLDDEDFEDLNDDVF